MFQFSTLLTRPDAGTNRRRLSDADPEPRSSSARLNDENSLMSAAGQCVTDRVRRDLDDQMQRLAELLDRVESLEFEREAESADIFSLGETDRPDEPPEQPRIFDDDAGAPGTDVEVPAPDVTPDWQFDMYADEGATGDESAATSVVLPPIIPLSTREIECLTAPSVICNSPSTAAIESELFTPLANPPLSVEQKPDVPARNESQPITPSRETDCEPLASPSSLCSGVIEPSEEASRPEPIATETPRIEMPVPNESVPDSTLPRPVKPAPGRREAERRAFLKPLANAPLTSGVVQDYCLAPSQAPVEPHEDSLDAVQPGGELSSRRSDGLIQACDNTLCDKPASASAFPSVSTPLPLASEPLASAGVQMLCVSDSAACPTPSPVITSACSHSHSFGRTVHEKAAEHQSPTVLPQRSLRRTLALESPLAGDRVPPAPPKRGGSQLLSILAVIGGLLTLAALAYVASDLASWFGSP